jgi:hypothetical protein
MGNQEDKKFKKSLLVKQKISSKKQFLIHHINVRRKIKFRAMKLFMIKMKQIKRINVQMRKRVLINK